MQESITRFQNSGLPGPADIKIILQLKMQFGNFHGRMSHHTQSKFKVGGPDLCVSVT
jgi:hypothetical protein